MRISGKESTPGGYKIKELKIEGKKGDIDIRFIFSGLTIVESINCPFITGTVYIIDAFNILSNLPVMEGDKIKGKFELPDDDEFIKQYDQEDPQLEFEYEIYSVVASAKVKQDVQGLVLSFCSSIWSDHLKGRISKGFCQTPYTSAAKQIYDEFLKKGGMQENIKTKELKIEQSDGLFNFIIPNWKPLDAIGWLLARAKKGKAVNYKFFEDKKEFHLETLEKLMSQGPKMTLYDASPNMAVEGQKNGSGVTSQYRQSEMEIRYNQLWNFSIGNIQNINEASGYYMFGRRMITHDLTFKRVKDYYFTGPEAGNYKLDKPRDYMDDFNDYTHLGGDEPLIDEKIAKSMGPKEGDDKLVMYPLHHHQWTGVEDNFKPEDWLRQYRAVREHPLYYTATAQGYGKFSLKAGDVVTISRNSPQWTHQDEPKKDSRHDGDWLITSIKRHFGSYIDGHHMIIQLARNARTNKSDHIWKQIQEPNFEGDKETY